MTIQYAVEKDKEEKMSKSDEQTSEKRELNLLVVCENMKPL